MAVRPIDRLGLREHGDLRALRAEQLEEEGLLRQTHAGRGEAVRGERRLQLRDCGVRCARPGVRQLLGGSPSAWRLALEHAGLDVPHLEPRTVISTANPFVCIRMCPRYKSPRPRQTISE
jgi:hypothetical protein